MLARGECARALGVGIPIQFDAESHAAPSQQDVTVRAEARWLHPVLELLEICRTIWVLLELQTQCALLLLSDLETLHERIRVSDDELLVVVIDRQVVYRFLGVAHSSPFLRYRSERNSILDSVSSVLIRAYRTVEQEQTIGETRISPEGVYCRKRIDGLTLAKECHPEGEKEGSQNRNELVP